MAKLVDEGDGRVVEPDDVQTPPMYDPTRPQVVTADTARQGPLGRPVFLVLVVAIVLAVIGMMLAWSMSGGFRPS